MTLLERIRQRIRDHGVLTVAEYMEMALADAEQGYYTTRIPLGRKGDFTTAPEISQIFGEMIGIWCAEVWHMHGQPRMELVELGPGMGTLMDDLLRGTRNVPGFHDALTIRMVEMSPVLEARQREKLEGKHPRITWHRRVPDAELPRLVVANEFFDALPIRQFRAEQEGFSERVVSLPVAGEGLAFDWDDAGDTLPADFPRVVAGELPDGTIIELCPDAQEILYHLARDTAQQGGAVLVVDYGYIRPPQFGVYAGGDTFQAMKKHDFCDVLETPGEADLTAHVDFSTLSDIAVAAGCYVPPVLTQRDFLLRMGVQERLQVLCQRSDSAMQRKILADGLHRLTAAEEMGELFKVLAVMPAGIPAPVFTQPTPQAGETGNDTAG